LDLDIYVITVFCLVDDSLKELLQGRRFRQRGPDPTMTDSEVMTMEVVGEYMGLSQDQAIFRYFLRDYSHFFSALKRVHRTTFVRQATNLWKLKEQLWQHLLSRITYDRDFALVDSFPLPVCQFARAYRCRRFKGEAAFGKDTLARQTFYGFRVHVRLCWPGVITRIAIAPANIHETVVVPDLTANTMGLLVGRPQLLEPLPEGGVTQQRHRIASTLPQRFA